VGFSRWPVLPTFGLGFPRSTLSEVAVSSPVLEVEQLDVTLGGATILRGLSLDLHRGESIAIIGPSGVGKTTLLNCILGTVRPQGGTIRVADTNVVGLRGRALAQLRASRIGIVFQHGELLGELSPVENVALPALIAGRPRNEAVARATALLGAFAVPQDREAADQLSGGERQRTALARALVNEPTVVLADEPTGSLDPAIRDNVADVLFGAPKQWECGLLVVTHDPAIAARADRVVDLSAMNSGRAR
jgi:lipoprotein-releasing system ATP-binding protein